ncbi:MAG: MBL fold metallo-hydrolase [Chloroflexi bacterium]|nr:MBL fold metallo-hydrolase [Chloroflexota bacterium]
MRAIAENIYFEDSYAGVTVGAITFPYGTLLIDAPLRSEDARTWKAALLTQSRGTHRLNVILDMHADRTLGIRGIEFPIVAHERTAEAFQERTTTFKGYNFETGAEWERYPEVSGTRWERPNITFTDHISLHWGGPEICIEHHPGPTSGASWVHIPAEKILFVGDAVTPNQPPFLARANLEIWLEALNLLTSRPFMDYAIISGRGGPVTVDAIREQREFLKSIDGRLKTLSKRNAKPEDTLKIIPDLLKKLSFPSKMESFYTQRLQNGLLQYYRRYSE